MPTVTLNRKVFEKLVGKKLSDDKLKDRISMMGTDLESVDDSEINVEIFPNRPDLLSEQGFARAFSSFIGQKKGLRKYNVKKSSEKVIVEKSLNGVRPFTACAIVKGLNFDDEKIKEIIQIQEKLHVTYGRNRKKAAIGVYPFEKIKPPIRFLAKKPEEIKFRPLESPVEMNGLQVLSKHPTGRDYGHLLEGKDKFPIFVDSQDQILSMPPIINSHHIGKITEDTKDVFIECSGFDYDVLSKCLNMIVTALADMGGKIYSMEIDMNGKKLYSPDLDPSKIDCDIEYVNKILGLDLNEKEMKNLLEKMGYGYNKGKALVPCYRADVLHPIDLIEDIAIAYGYENFEEIIPNVATVGQEDQFEIFKRKISEMLIGLGNIECKTYHLINKEVQTNFMGIDMEVVLIDNALNQEYNSLAAWVTPSIMNVLKINKHHEYPQNIFAIGTIFKKDDNQETGILEQDRLSCIICSEDADYTKIRQVLDYVFSSLGINYEISSTEHESFISGRVGRASVKGNDVAYIGELSPEVLENFEIEMPVSCFELNLTELYDIISNDL